MVPRVSRKYTHYVNPSEREKPIASVCIPYIQGTSERIRHFITGYIMHTPFQVSNTIRQHHGHYEVDELYQPLSEKELISPPCTKCVLDLFLKSLLEE